MAKGIFSIWKDSMEKVGEIRKTNSKIQCPKCDSKDIKTLKPNMMKKASESYLQILTLGIRKPTSTLHVCRSCGFSWEPR